VLENGDVVAVKKLVSIPGDNDVQFENEVYHLLMLKHKNIVRFLGYCFETRHVCILHKGRYCFAEMPEKLLCLEYLPNGSLDRLISDESHGLDWCKRYEIIRGICSGLHYLHEILVSPDSLVNNNLELMLRIWVDHLVTWHQNTCTKE